MAVCAVVRRRLTLLACRPSHDLGQSRQTLYTAFDSVRFEYFGIFATGRFADILTRSQTTRGSAYF